MDTAFPISLQAYETASRSTDRPTIVLARTLKGKGLIGIEGLEHWHGKALPKDTAAKVIAELEKHLTGAETEWKPKLPPVRPDSSKAVTGGNARSGGKTALCNRRQGSRHEKGLWRQPVRSGEG